MNLQKKVGDKVSRGCLIAGYKWWGTQTFKNARFNNEQEKLAIMNKYKQMAKNGEIDDLKFYINTPTSVKPVRVE